MRNNSGNHTLNKTIQSFMIKIGIFVGIVFFLFPFSIFILIFGFNSIKNYFSKEWKKSGIDEYMKKNYGANYEKIISEIKKSQKYKQRVHKNRQKRDQVEDLFTNNNGVQIDEEFERESEQKFRKLQNELEEKKQKEKMFYKQTSQTLQDKLSQKTYAAKKEIRSNSHLKNSSYSSTSKNKNFFGNNKKKRTIGEGKSIWDNYESVTERFSSNKK